MSAIFVSDCHVYDTVAAGDPIEGHPDVVGEPHHGHVCIARSCY